MNVVSHVNQIRQCAWKRF